MMDLAQRDLKHIFHPCSQMKDYLRYMPVNVESAEGSYLTLSNGEKIIDAISSWWCKSLGHAHPRLKNALFKQAHKFEHVIQANTTNEPIVQLSEKLCALTKTLNKIFYSCGGSNAVEIAMKMSIHARKIMGQEERTKFIALKNGYHGETIGALSVSDLQIYKEPYSDLIFESHLIENIPYVNGIEDPKWLNSNYHSGLIKNELSQLAETTTAIIVEPIVQGAGGMKIYSQHFLAELRKWSYENDIHFIADEIMTGFGRTGKMLACHHANIEPDFMCIGKGLTSGWLPLSAVLTSNKIVDLFYDDYKSGKSFLHSETYSGNSLGIAVALESLKIIEDEQILSNVPRIESVMRGFFNEIANRTGKLKNVRSLGGIVAAELVSHSKKERIGFEVALNAIKYGALLRPLGNTIYWLPPLNINSNTLEELYHITLKAIEDAYHT